MAWCLIFILSYLNLILNQYGTILTWDIDTIRLLHTQSIAIGYLLQSSQPVGVIDTRRVLIFREKKWRSQFSTFRIATFAAQ
jgi:glycerol-3-phosphate responsive antiterminator